MKLVPMRKYIIHIILILVITSMLLAFFNDGILISNDFPLRQRWSVNLKEKIQGLSTDGAHIIFARASRKISAIDVRSGEILWERELSRQAISAPAVEENGAVYIADSKNIWAFDQLNGKVIWKVPATMSVDRVRSVSKNVIAVESGSDISVYDASDGSFLWNKPVCRYGGVQAYADHSQVFVPCIGRFWSMNGSSGETEWNTEASYNIAEVAYQDGVMYYSPERNSVSAYNLRDRKVIWKTPFQGEGYRRFKILEDKVYIIGSGKVCTLQKTTGDQLWCINFNEPQNPTTIDHQLFVFNGYQNNISAFDMPSGKKMGDLTVRNMKFYMIERELMVSLNNVLVFGSDTRVFGYGH